MKTSWLTRKNFYSPVTCTSKIQQYQPLTFGPLLYHCHYVKFFKLHCQENMIVGQMQVVQNIHYHFTYMDFEGQSYAFLSDFILQPK